MSKIETLAKNVNIIRNAQAKMDLSVIDAKDALGINTALEYIADLLQVYADFENGFDPDKESE